MSRNERKNGFTLIELLIVIAIIGILAALAVPMYRGFTVKAKLTEVTISMGNVASAVGAYYMDNNSTWPPPLNTQASLKGTLGVDIPVANYIDINSAFVGAQGLITFTVKNTKEPNVDGNTIILRPDTTSGGINWKWSTGANFPENLRPKN